MRNTIIAIIFSLIFFMACSDEGGGGNQNSKTLDLVCTPDDQNTFVSCVDADGAVVCDTKADCDTLCKQKTCDVKDKDSEDGSNTGGGCNTKTNPVTGHLMRQNSVLSEDVDCDGVYGWLPGKTISTIQVDEDTVQKRLIERFIDINKGEAMVLIHQTESVRSKVIEAKTWKFNAAQTQISNKSYKDDPRNGGARAINSKEFTYDSQGHELTLKNYQGDFEADGTVNSSLVSTYTPDGKLLTQKNYDGDFEDANLEVKDSTKFFYNYKGFSTAYKKYRGDFDQGGSVSFSLTSKINASQTETKTKEYGSEELDGFEPEEVGEGADVREDIPDFEVRGAIPTRSIIVTSQKNGQTMTMSFKYFDGDCDTRGALIRMSSIDVMMPDKNKFKMYNGDFEQGGDIMYSRLSMLNNFGLPLTEKTYPQADFEDPNAIVDSSAKGLYDAKGNTTRYTRFDGDYDVANPPISHEYLVEDYQPIRTSIHPTDLTSVFNEMLISVNF